MTKQLKCEEIFALMSVRNTNEPTLKSQTIYAADPECSLYCTGLIPLLTSIITMVIIIIVITEVHNEKFR